jgi:hypothetical protein
MNRFDRAILCLADRVPLSFAIGAPLGFVGGMASSMILHRVTGPWHTVLLIAMIGAGFGLGALGGSWKARWERRHHIDRCTDCFRPGRWAIRITVRADDSLAIPQEPPWCHTGCWCDRHRMKHLLRFLRPELRPIYSEVTLVPYERYWTRPGTGERSHRP